MVRPRSCRVIYYSNTPALERRHQAFGRVNYHLIETQYLEILNSIQMTRDQISILNSNKNTIQDVIPTLILIISLYFIGDPSHLKDKNIRLFSNLRCKTHIDFQWCKAFSLLMSCSEKIQTNFYKKKNSLLDYKTF